MEAPEPTPRSDPLGYLAQRKFSQRLPRCPRTRLPVSYADIGDPDGVPVLWMLPSGCSRWFAAPQDPLAKRYGIRLILVDRPGVGATPSVPLADRIEVSCNLMVSVLEHLDVKPAHMIVTSAGIYYALHLLLNHPTTFASALSPPPSIYLVAPWSPLLPADHPDYYLSYFTWIPSQVIATQHITLPQLLKLAKTGSSLWNTGLKTLWSTLDSAKSFISGTGTSVPSSSSSSTKLSEGLVHEHQIPGELGGESGAVSSAAVPMSVDGVEYKSEDAEEEDQSPHSGGMWGKFPCCVSCTTTDYFQAEEFSGVGQEHLICLNRGPIDTGHVWLEQTIRSLATKLRAPLSAEEVAAGRGKPVLDVHVWWGWEDGMVPRKGQLWFNKTLSRFPGELKLTVHDVPTGDHTDLLGRSDGIYEVYDLIRQRG